MKKMICIVVALIMCVSISASAATQLLSRDEIPLLSDDSHEIVVLKALNIMNGRPDGMELDKEVTRAEAVMLIWRVSGISFNDLGYETPTFGDTRGHWAYDAIEKFYRAGLIDGTGENTFEPDRNITGKEFVKILLAALGFEVKSLDDAEKMGLQKRLLTNNYTKSLVKQNMTLRRSDAARFCYAAFLVKTADGKMLFEKHPGAEELLTATDISKAKPCFADEMNGYMPDDENYMFSPLSIKMALALAANGAEGETRDEILKAVGIDDLNKFNEKSRKMIDSYKDSGVLDVNIANSIWVKEDWDFSEEYRDIVSKFYDAEAEKVNDSDAVERINKWAEEKTNGKIPSVINDSAFDAALINAIYFKGYWANQFDEEYTKKAWFTSRDGSRKEIDFMNQTKSMRYATDGNITIAELPYKRNIDTGDENLTSENNVSMYLIMGETDEPVRLINETELTYGRAELSVPKFKIEYSDEIGDALKAMGIKKAWRNDAEFEKMFKKDNMKIDTVLHKTYISVDENGTEAAAVTALLMVGTGMIQKEPEKLIFDKPFTFVIKDNTNDEILFVGEYAYAK